MIKVSDLYAPPGVAPEGSQVIAPASMFTADHGFKPPVGDSEDLRRVLALPRRPPIEVGSDRAEALIQMMTARYRRERDTTCRCALPRNQGGFERECILSLNLPQSWALYEMGIVQGLLGPISPGFGKTILDILAPFALMPPNEPDPRLFSVVLLVPPGLVSQLIDEYHLLSQHFRVPSLSVVGRDFALDAGRDVPVLHVLAYSKLQRPEATSILKTIRPRAIISDEAHSLRNADAVRTNRVMRYFQEFPETRFACWTGSITDSSICDYGHLAMTALRKHSPLPLNPEVTKEWATALDPKSDFPADPGKLLEGLIAGGFQPAGEHVHAGFNRRLIETEGVVTTRGAVIESEIVITKRIPPTMPDELAEMLKNVREAMQRPDGEELLTPLDVARCARELACGFYYKWIYPRAADADLEEGGLIDQWFVARRAWRCELRERLKYRTEHLDSPYLCQLAAMRYHGDIAKGTLVEILDEDTGEMRQVDTSHLPTWNALNWCRWRDIKDLVQPETEAVRVDDYLARDAAEWGLENRGIIWYDKTAFGAWVAELSGLPRYGGGPEAAERMIGSPRFRGEDGSRSIIASIKSHGTGRDGLQRIFKTQLVANPMSSATGWHQLLSRLHRLGQKAPVVYAEFYAHTPELEASYQQACARALYVERTVGDPQKLRGFRK